MENEITLEEYLERARQEIETFKEWYIESHEQASKNFPLKMTESDWNEQELTFRNFEVL